MNVPLDGTLWTPFEPSLSPTNNCMLSGFALIIQPKDHLKRIPIFTCNSGMIVCVKDHVEQIEIVEIVCEHLHAKFLFAAPLPNYSEGTAH